jgi:hypothetical protein
MALGLATVATIVVVALYGSIRSPGSGPAPALRAVTSADVARVTSVLAKDWTRARAADAAWINSCYAYGPGDCTDAVRRQVIALQRVLGDVSSQRVAGTQLAPILDGRFRQSVAAALAMKKTELALLTNGQFADGRLPVATHPLTPGQITEFNRTVHDTDPVICIQPVGAALQNATGTSTAHHPLFLPYPLSTGYILLGGRGPCPAAPKG